MTPINTTDPARSSPSGPSGYQEGSFVEEPFAMKEAIAKAGGYHFHHLEVRGRQALFFWRRSGAGIIRVRRIPPTRTRPEEWQWQEAGAGKWHPLTDEVWGRLTPLEAKPQAAFSSLCDRCEKPIPSRDSQFKLVVYKRPVEGERLPPLIAEILKETGGELILSPLPVKTEYVLCPSCIPPGYVACRRCGHCHRVRDDGAPVTCWRT